MCWRLDRGLLVKKPRRGNIWGRGEGARWTAGRDALARAQKAGGRPEGNTPVSKVLAATNRQEKEPGTFLEWLYSVCIVGEVKE